MHSVIFMAQRSTKLWLGCICHRICALWRVHVGHLFILPSHCSWLKGCWHVCYCASRSNLLQKECCLEASSSSWLIVWRLNSYSIILCGKRIKGALCSPWCSSALPLQYLFLPKFKAVTAGIFCFTIQGESGAAGALFPASVKSTT